MAIKKKAVSKKNNKAGISTLGIFAAAGLLTYLGHKYLSVPVAVVKSIDVADATAQITFDKKPYEISIAPGAEQVIPGEAGFELRTQRAGSKLELRVFKNDKVKSYRAQTIV